MHSGALNAPRRTVWKPLSKRAMRAQRNYRPCNFTRGCTCTDAVATGEPSKYQLSTSAHVITSVGHRCHFHRCAKFQPRYIEKRQFLNSTAYFVSRFYVMSFDRGVIEFVLLIFICDVQHMYLNKHLNV